MKCVNVNSGFVLIFSISTCNLLSSIVFSSSSISILSDVNLAVSFTASSYPS